MNEPTELIIFDCDGVLVDSEPISIGVLVEVITAAGHAITPEAAYERFLGRSMASIRDMLAADDSLHMQDMHLEEIRARLYSRFEAELQPIPGIVDAVGRLAGVKRCVASSSNPDRIRLSLRLTGLLDLFEPNIFSATMVERGKPQPDLFLHAARKMGVAPERCIVVEDSPAGIEAARRAGMRVFAFAGGSHAEAGSLRAAFDALRPDIIFDDMRDLPRLASDVVTAA